jgi:hypothetical protein
MMNNILSLLDTWSQSELFYREQPLNLILTLEICSQKLKLKMNYDHKFFYSLELQIVPNFSGIVRIVPEIILEKYIVPQCP